MDSSYVDNPFRGSCYSESREDLLLENWLPPKKETKFKDFIQRRKVSIISISIAILIATVISVAVTIHVYSSPCKNDGIYIKEDGKLKCNCTGTGFNGDQCEISVITAPKELPRKSNGTSEDHSSSQPAPNKLPTSSKETHTEIKKISQQIPEELPGYRSPRGNPKELPRISQAPNELPNANITRPKIH